MFTGLVRSEGLIPEDPSIKYAFEICSAMSIMLLEYSLAYEK